MPKKITRVNRNSCPGRLDASKKRISPHQRSVSDVKTQSTSGKKIKIDNDKELIQNLNTHYRVVDFLLVFTTISTLVKCIKCDGKITFQSSAQQGLGFKIKVTCEKCKQLQFVPSSERVEGGAYEINYRFVFVMRILGLGLAGCDKFCGLMDLCSTFFSPSTYSSYMKRMCATIQAVSNSFLDSAIKEEIKSMCQANNIEQTSTKASELTVSGDGTWQKRGFCSSYGVSSLIGHYSGKVLDIFVSSARCKLCKTWKSKLTSAQYEEWYEVHVSEDKCQINHIGPSGNMEVAAIRAMFERSKNKGVIYRNYIGDGDSKTYIGVMNSKPYGDQFMINKKECIGHVQKRMGKRLRDLVKKSAIMKTTAAREKKKRTSLSGKGKLTGKMIDKLTIYYGLAIRRNSDSVEKMRSAIWATYYNYSSTDEKPQHQYCPSGVDSWCEWQKAVAAGDISSFHHSYTALETDVLEAIKPIYEDLSKTPLLERCVGSFTQNNNESLNQLIWKIAPKVLNGSTEMVEIAANLAACIFNEGYLSLLHFMQEMNVKPGPICHDWARKKDSTRISEAEKKTEAECKEGATARRQQQQDALNILDDSCLLYGAGIEKFV